MAAHQYSNSRLKTSRQHCSGITFVVWTYVTLFLVAIGILFTSLLSGENSQKPVSLNLYGKLSPTDQRHFEAFGWPYMDMKGDFNCSYLDQTSLEYITTGWTKSVYRFKWRNEYLALKTVNPIGKDVGRCVFNDTMRNCFDKASSKLLKEFILSQELQHNSIVKVLGWCISGYKVAMVTELCEPFDTINFLTMSFPLRLKISLDVARLVNYLSKTPLGSIALVDFRREQFLLCNGTLKLTDLDDASIEEPSCLSQQDCKAGKCLNSLCVGYNEFQNVIIMVREIIGFTLAFDTPVKLRPALSHLIVTSEKLDSYSVLMQLEKVMARFCKSNKSCV